MDKVKIKDIKTGAVKEVKKSLAGDFIGTGKFVLVDDEKNNEYKEPTSFSSKKNK